MAAGGGPEGAAEALSWSPGSAPQPPAGLEVKLGALVLLLVVPLGCGLAPLCCFRQPPADTRSPLLSLVSCFAGGVFLGTCLLDLLPDYLAAIGAALEGLRVPLQFPLPQFILAMGFFLVLVLEQVALAQRDPPPPPSPSPSPEETRALLLPPPASIQAPQPPAAPRSPRSAVRAASLVLALALHAALEGLALGLRGGEAAAAARLGLALLLHKSAVAVSLALQLLRGRLRPPAIAAALGLFALMSPLGVGVGTAVAAAGDGPRQRLWRGVLEGLAVGTFFYVTFLEILPQGLGDPRQRVPKVILLLAGFALVTAILFIKM